MITINDESGQISIFLCIILIAILFLSFVLIDGARIRCAENMVQRSVEVASESVLSMYNSGLMERYGIFAMSEDFFETQRQIEYYVNENLMTNKSLGRQVNLFDFEIEDIEIQPLYNLTENTIVKSQILEHMKYRAPLKIGDEFLDKINSFKEVSKSAGAYEKKVKLDGLLSNIDGACKNLKQDIDGFLEEDSICINAFSETARISVREEIADCIVERRKQEEVLSSLIAKMEDLRRLIDDRRDDIDEIEDEIDSVKRAINEILSENSNDENTNEDAAEQQINSLKDRLAALIDKKGTKQDSLDRLEDRLSSSRDQESQLGDNITKLNHKASEAFDTLYYQLTIEYMEPNQKAITSIEKIVQVKDKVLELISEIRLFLGDGFADDSMGFSSQLLSEVNNLADKVLEGAKAIDMLEDVRSNLTFLQNQKHKLDSVKKLLDDGFDIPGEYSDILVQLGHDEQCYNHITYTYETVGGGVTEKDDRREKTDAAKRLLDDVNSAIEQVFGDFAKSGIDIETLPSRYKVHTILPDIEDDLVENVLIDKPEIVDEDEIDLENETYLSEVDEQIDFTDKGGFAQEGLSFLRDVGQKITDNALNLRDNMYINEYIIKTFSNALDGTLSSEEALDETNEQHFFTREIEYIINGNGSEKVNGLIMNAKILLTRFACNTIHVYTDQLKRDSATSIATAACSWWTGGLGVPLLSNLIMCGWGMGESALDLKDILENKEVPFYKMKGDWKLGLGLIFDEGSDLAKSNVSLGYEDYLRLFLLVTDNDKKISRIEDIIRVNLKGSNFDKELYDMHTCIRVEAVISVNYLFPSSRLIYNDSHNIDKRHIFRVVIYKGY